MDVTILNRQRARRLERNRLGRFVDRLAQTFPPPSEPADLDICLVSDKRMRELNRRFRGLDRPTDVLSFRGSSRRNAEGRFHLGDIVISVSSAGRQARDRRHSLDRELQLLTLHGYLHLLGYDHETDNGTMARIERRLARRLFPALVKSSR